MSTKVDQLRVIEALDAMGRKRTLEEDSSHDDADAGHYDGVVVGQLKVKDERAARAKRRWKIVQKHVCITQWLSKDLMRRQIKRFALAQEALVDTVMASKDDLVDVLVRIREQLLSLLDAENCYLVLETNRAVLEFDGRSIYQSARAKRGIFRKTFESAETRFVPSVTADQECCAGINAIDVRVSLAHDENNARGSVSVLTFMMAQSYICLPLVDADNRVQAIAEIFNTRHDPNVISAWLNQTAHGSLHSFRSFVGKLIKAYEKRGHLHEMLHTGSVLQSAESRRSSFGPNPGRRSSLSQPNEYSMEGLVELLRQTTLVEKCTVYAYDKQADILWSRLSDCSSVASTVKNGEGIVGKAAKSGELIHYSTRQDGSENQRLELLAAVKLISTQQLDVLAIPTSNVNKLMNGVVLLQNKRNGHPFDDVDVAMAVNISRYIGNALHNSELHEAIHKAQGKAQTLLDLSAVLFRELETNSLLLAIIRAIKKPMNASKCGVFLMDEEKNDLYSPVGSEIASDLSQEVFRIPADAGIVGAAAQSGEIINIREAYLDSRFNQSVDKRTGFVTRSILAVPIKDASGKVLGVLEMVNKLSKQYFDKDDEELARGIAYYFAIALNNARLFEAAKSAMRRSDAMLAMMQVISSNNENVGDVFKSLIETACQILNIEHGSLFFVDELSKTLFCRIGSNWKGYSIPIGQFVPGKVAASGKLMRLTNPEAHLDFDRTYHEITGIEAKGLLCVPIKSTQRSGAAIAVFYGVNKVGTARSIFTDEDTKIASAICNEMSPIIERRSWELVFQSDASSEANDLTQVTRSFLSQYTTTPTLSRRRSSMHTRSRSATPSLQITLENPPFVSTPRLLATVAESVICKWNLDPGLYAPPQLVDFVVEMFQHFDLLQRYDVQLATLKRFIVSVKGQYQDIPYHNFHHGFTTLHVTFLMVLNQCNGSPLQLPQSPTAAGCDSSASRNLLEVRDQMSIFIAAICHDMNHNGRTNDFHIRYRTAIAMLYNDQSVLENMHAAACFETMRRTGHDILEHAPSAEYRLIRKSIIRAILATDMHNHAAIVSQLHEKLKPEVFNPEDETHKELLLNAIVHSADISGPAFTEELHVRWSLQLLVEFNMQYEEETALGMTPTPYMNAKPGSYELGKLNLAFIDSCVFPLWNLMSTFLTGLDGCMQNIQKNRQVWIKQMEDAQANAAAFHSSTSAVSAVGAPTSHANHKDKEDSKLEVAPPQVVSNDHSEAHVASPPTKDVSPVKAP